MRSFSGFLKILAGAFGMPVVGYQATTIIWVSEPFLAIVTAGALAIAAIVMIDDGAEKLAE
jgi:hypothetical protein